MARPPSKLYEFQKTVRRHKFGFVKAHVNSFDFIINCAAAPHSIDPYTALLEQDSTMCLVGLPDKPPAVSIFNLIGRRLSVAGSMIGGMPETQEMLDYLGSKRSPQTSK